MPPLITLGKDCPIRKILSIMESSNSMEILHDKWSQVASKLETPSATIKKFRDDLILNKISLYDAVHDILEDWVGRSGAAATVQDLVDVLEKTVGLHGCAESLQKAFLIDPSNKIKKFCRLPQGLQAFLTSSSSKYILLHTMDSYITCEKIRENLKLECEFSEWRNFLKLLSSSNGVDPRKLYVLTDCKVNHLDQLMPKVQNVNDLNKLVLVIASEKHENNHLDILEEKLLWKETVDIKVDSLEWDDLSPDNQIQTMEQLQHKFKIRIEEENLDKMLNEKLLVDLLKGNELQPFNSSVPSELSYYVNRTILSRHIISKQFLEEECPDIFIFSGMDWNELSELVQNRVTDNTTNQIRAGRVTDRFLLLDQPAHFEKLCKLAKHPVHKISKQDDGRLKWEGSHGSVKVIQNYVDSNLQNKLTEEEFLEMLPSNRPVCIVDTPGMGKSVLLAHMGNRLAKLCQDKIICFSVMADFIKLIKETGMYTVDKGIAIESALQTATCKNDLGRAVLSSKLKLTEEEGNILIELLLDGLDEVESADSFLAYDILQVIEASFKSIRLWITSRPHLLNQLESKLNILGHTLEPFRTENQIQFLTSYWSRERNLNLEQLEPFAVKCMKILKSSMNTQAHDIAGVPLQCLLLAEVYEEEAVEQAGSLTSTASPQLPINSISSLYTLLIEKKIQKYEAVYSKSTKFTTEEILDMHIRLSLELLFPENSENLKKSLFGPVDLGEMLKVGVLESAPGSPEGFRFIHRTFAEYFVASVFTLEANHQNEDQLADWLSEKVLACKRFQFGLKHNIPTVSYKFLHPVICYFLNNLLALDLDHHVSSLKLQQNPRNLAHACANGDYVHIFNYFHKLDAFRRSGSSSIFDENFLLITIHSSSLELIKLSLECFEKEYQFELELQKKALLVAVRRGDFSIVEFLLKERKLLGIVEYTRFLMHECVSNSKNKSEEKIENKIQICRRLAAISPSLLEDKDGYGRTPLLGNDVHVKIQIELMARLGANIFAQNEDKDCVLHLNVIRKLSPQDYHTLVMSIPQHAMEKLVQLKGSFGHTPLMRLVEQIEPLPETLDKFKNAGADFNGADQRGFSVLATAVLNGRSGSTIRKLIEYGGKPTWKKGLRAKSLLHYAAEYGNPEATRVLVEWIDVNVRDWTWSTPLDYAVWSESKSGSRFETGVVLHQLGGTFQYLEGRSLLHGVVLSMNMESIRLLIQLQADLNAADTLGNTPLHLAVRYKEKHKMYSYFEVAKLLLDNKANPYVLNLNGETPFHLALKSNPLLDLQTYKLLKSQTAWTPEVASLALRFVIQEGGNLNHHELHLLLKECETHGADFNLKDMEGNSLLHLAVAKGNVEAVHYLIIKKVNIHSMNNLQETALHKAANVKDFPTAFEIVKELIDNGSVYVKDNLVCTFLHHFIWKHPIPSHFHSVSVYLIQKGHSKLFENPGGKDNVTPLQMAFLHFVPDIKTLSMLHSSGVNFNTVDKSGDSALTYAIKRKRSDEVLSWLVEFGGDYKRLNTQNQNLLHIAAAEGTESSLKFLLEMEELEVNWKDEEGNTPLHSALLSKPWSVEKVRLLISMGALHDISNLRGLTPLAMVMSGEDGSVKQRLMVMFTKPYNHFESNFSDSSKEVGSEGSDSEGSAEITHL